MRTIRIFVSSPGDVQLERQKAAEVVERLQGEVSAHAKLVPYFWEHEPMLATKDFQENIPSPAEFDIVICILWSRLGTRLHSKHRRDDGTLYKSGTEFEFEEAVRGWQETNGDRPDILVYRRDYLRLEVTDEHLEQAAEKMRQYNGLLEFFDKWFRSPDEAVFTGAYNPYRNLADFEQKLYRALRTVIFKRLPKEAEYARMRATWSRGSPFRGLQFFDKEHGPVFYGRSRAVDDIIGLLRRRAETAKPFVLVFGSSGVGKSSLVRAGILPQLLKPGVIEGIGHWQHAIFRPSDGSRLLEPKAAAELPGAYGLYRGLAKALMQPEAIGVECPGTEWTLMRYLESHHEPAAKTVQAALDGVAERHQQEMQLDSPQAVRLLLVIDQMEELFTHHNLTAWDRRRFFGLLDWLLRTGRVWVLATLRSDFFPRCETIPELMELKEGNGQYHLQMPEEYEISQMIRWPAAAAGLRFAEDIQKGERLEDLIRDAALANRESLPLLQFALEELYQRRTQDDVLTLEAYREIGGVEGSLAQRAESEWQAFVSEHDESTANAALDVVLRLLVTADPEDRQTFARRWSQECFASANPVERAFVERFVRARLFIADVSERGLPMVSLAHEALLVHWQRLRQWLDTNQEDLRTLLRVRNASATWAEKDRSPDYLLQSGKPVAEAKDLLIRNRAGLSGVEIDFIELSAEAARVELERRAEEARQRAEQEAAHARALEKSLAETQAAKTEADSAARRATTARSEAEKLVQFMTFDLNSKLQKIGKLELLKDVNLRVEEYYKVFGGENEEIDSLRRRAASLHNRGDILRGQGDLAGALAAHQEGIAIDERLVALNPTLPERNLVSLHYVQTGAILYSLGRLDEALEIYRSPIEFYEQLAPSQSDAADWISTFCLLLFGRAQVLDSRNRLGEAAADYKRAADLCAQGLEAKPGEVGLLKILWPAQAGLGQIRLGQGNTTDALHCHRGAVETICELIKADPESIGWHYDLIQERVHLSQVLLQQGQEPAAANELEEARAVAERLVVHDPTNARWKNGLAMTCVYQGEFYQRQNDSEAALKSFKEAETILEALIAEDSRNAEFIRYRNQCRMKIAEILVVQGDRQGVFQQVEPLGDTRLTGTGSTQQFVEAELQRIQGKILAAEAQMRAGRWDAALMGYLGALPALEKLASPANANAGAMEALGALLAQIGGAFVAKGSPLEAKEALLRSISVIRDRLLAIDPENLRWQAQLSKAEAQLGLALLGIGDTDAALRTYLGAVTRTERLIPKRPESGDLQHDLSGIYIGLGNVLSKRGDKLGARRAFEAAIQIARKLVDRDPNNALWQSALAGYWTILGEALAAEKAPNEALHAYRQSLAVWERLRGRGENNPFWETQEALACFRIAILSSQVEPTNFRKMRDMLSRCLTIMNRVKGAAVLTADQQNLLRLCEVALQGLPV
ncbi:MAG: tetratricopeptide repeat protein [Verrucomicrobia bacterium]|nr:tetratricopeptide repeat protein [Verrucomicrobiota bacterium]